MVVRTSELASVQWPTPYWHLESPPTGPTVFHSNDSYTLLKYAFGLGAGNAITKPRLLLSSVTNNNRHTAKVVNRMQRMLSFAILFDYGS